MCYLPHCWAGTAQASRLPFPLEIGAIGNEDCLPAFSSPAHFFPVPFSTFIFIIPLLAFIVRNHHTEHILAQRAVCFTVVAGEAVFQLP